MCKCATLRSADLRPASCGCGGSVRRAGGLFDDMAKLKALANSDGVRLVAMVVGGSPGVILKAVADNPNNIGAATRQAAGDLRLLYGTAEIAAPLAAVAAPPLAPVLVPMGQVSGAIAKLCLPISEGRPPSAADLGAAAASVLPLLGAFVDAKTISAVQAALAPAFAQVAPTTSRPSSSGASMTPLESASRVILSLFTAAALARSDARERIERELEAMRTMSSVYDIRTRFAVVRFRDAWRARQRPLSFGAAVDLWKAQVAGQPWWPAVLAEYQAQSGTLAPGTLPNIRLPSRPPTLGGAPPPSGGGGGGGLVAAAAALLFFLR